MATEAEIREDALEDMKLNQQQLKDIHPRPYPTLGEVIGMDAVLKAFAPLASFVKDPSDPPVQIENKRHSIAGWQADIAEAEAAITRLEAEIIEIAAAHGLFGEGA